MKKITFKTTVRERYYFFFGGLCATTLVGLFSFVIGNTLGSVIVTNFIILMYLARQFRKMGEDI